MAFHQKECVETISETLVRPETNQARHRLAFRALWKWPDRATLERGDRFPETRARCWQKDGRRGRLDNSCALCLLQGRIQPPDTETGPVNLPNNSLLATHRDSRSYSTGRTNARILCGTGTDHKDQIASQRGARFATLIDSRQFSRESASHISFFFLARGGAVLGPRLSMSCTRTLPHSIVSLI